MVLEKIAADLQPYLKGEVRLREPMKHHTTWKVGGPADIFIPVQKKADVSYTLKYAYKHNIPCYILGNGSNVLVLDKGVRGIVLKLAGGLNTVSIVGQKIIAEAGVRLPALAQKACQNGLSGLEEIAAIPGTIGGAVAINAGAYGSTIGQLVGKVEALNPKGELIELDKNDLYFDYRQSSLAKQKLTVLEVELQLHLDDPVLIQQRMERYLHQRTLKQPLNLPNAGSVFKNPKGVAAGYLIEKAGAKGFRKGGAQISDKHANFIVNVENATAQDILDLSACVKGMVYQTFNVQLQTEINLLGEE